MARAKANKDLAHPPMNSKHDSGPSDYEIKAQRLQERNEKSRLRMARKRAELKTRPIEEQLLAAERDRAHQATYRERHRNDLRVWEAQRRIEVYKKRFGPAAYAAYSRAKRERKRRARAKKEAKEAYHAAKNKNTSDGDPDSE
ncbi:hypothetical protein C8R43DRAFT_960630 [Mycena crocata]|nr:hypothetical protein C8R43DRAFT_960630 [Mycena crocata]